MTPRTIGPLLAFLAITVVALHAVGLTASGDFARTAVLTAWSLAGLAATLGTMAAALRVRAARLRLAWFLWSVGSLLWLGGALLRFFDSSVPSLAGALWIGFAVLAALALAFRCPPGSFSFRLFALDALPVVLAATAFSRIAHDHPRDVGHEVYAFLYPSAYTFLALVAIQLISLQGFTRAVRNGTFIFPAGFALLAAAALLWSPAALMTGDAVGHRADFLWSFGLLAIGAWGVRRALAPGAATRYQALQTGGGARSLAPAVAIVALILLEAFGPEWRDGVVDASIFVAVLAFSARFLLVWRESRKLVRALQEERDFTSAVIDTAGSLVCVSDGENRIVRFNRACEELTGYRADEIVGRPAWQLIPPEDVATVQARIAGVCAGNFPNQGENDWIARDGSRRRIAWTNTAVLDDHGGVAYVVATGIDVTERRRAEEALHESREHHRTIIETANDAFVAIDEAGAIVEWNRQAELTFGWKREEALGSSLAERIIPPEYRAAHLRGLTHFLATGEGPVLDKPIELTALRRDGSEFPIQLTIWPTRSGDAYQFNAFVQDITLRKEAEERLRAAEERYRELIEQLPIVTYINGSDPSVPVIYMSPQIESIIGYSVDEQMADPEIFSKLLHPEDRDRVLAEHERAFATGELLRTEYRVIARDGRVVWFQDEGRIARDEQGAPRLHGFLLDVTARKRAEEEQFESEARFHAMADSAPVLMWMSDADGEPSFFNQGWLDFTGRTLEQELNAPFEGIHPDDLEHARAIYGASLEGRTGSETQYRLWRSDGEYRWLFDRAVPRYLPDGSFAGLTGVAIDITERRRSERRLAAQHAVTRILAESSSLGDAAPRILQTMCESLDWDFGGVWQVDRKANVLRCVDLWDTPLLEATGFKTKSKEIAFARGKGLPGRVWATGEPLWVPDIHDDPNIPRAPFAARYGLHGAIGFPIVFGSDVLGAIEFFSREVREPDEELLRLMAVIGGQLGQFIERKDAEQKLREAESRYRVLVEQLPLVTYIVSADDENELLYVSPKIEEILGYPLESWTNEPMFFDRTLHPDDRERVHATARQWRADGTSCNLEYRCIAKDGRVVWFQDETVAVYDETGRRLHAQGYLLDITERKAAEQRVQQAEERYRTLVEQLPLAVYVDNLDETSSAIYASPQLESMLGYTAEEWVADPDLFPKVIHPDDRERVMAEHLRTLESEEPFDCDYRMIARDGRVVWVHDEDVTIRDETGRPLYSQGYLLDVTDRMKTEERLREAEERYRALVERLPAVVYACELGSTGKWHYVSPQIESILGITPGEWMAGDAPWTTHLHPEDRERAHREEDESVAQGAPIFSEYRMVTPDGRTVWLQDQATIIHDEEGKPLYLHGFMLDITERKEAEAELRLRQSAMAQMSTGILISNARLADNPIVYANQAFEQMTGYEVAEVLGRNCRFLQGLETDRAALQELRSAIAKEQPAKVTLLNYRKDGTPFWNELAISPIRDAGGEVTHFVGVQTDITYIKEAEAEIQRQIERLRELDALKDEFVALVSHELRTPLTSIRGYLELVLEGEAGELSEEQGRFLEVVDRNAQRLQRLVGDLLFVAQIEAGRLSLERSHVDLSALAAECVEAARPAADEKGILLALDAGRVPPVWADRARIGQLLDNLVSNALKFTPDGGRVEVRVLSRNGDALLEVSDSGIGIPKAEQKHLFERFFRTSSATTHAVQGTGLGLAITKAIAEGHGGRVVVESEEGTGTTFRVELPFNGVEAGAHNTNKEVAL